MSGTRSRMPRVPRRYTLAALLLCAMAVAPVRIPDEPPSDWIDPDTGHRVIRLSTEPGSTTLYFHDNAYTPDGDRYVFNSPSGIMLVDVAALGKAPPKAELVVPRAGGAYMARRTREVYFAQRPPGAAKGTVGEVYAYNVDTRRTRRVPYAPRTLINADESYTVSPIVTEDPTGQTPRPPRREPRPQLERMFPGR